MGDSNIYRFLCATEIPAEAKRFGRIVSDFNHVLWDEIVCSVAYKVLHQKFSQDEYAWRKLESTGRCTLVEASETDHIWGAGMKVNDPRIMDPRKWDGSNIQGWSLMQVSRR